MNNQEINITDLINTFLINTYKFIFKWYKVLIGFFFLGIIIAILFLSLKGNTYISTMTIKQNAVDYIALEELISGLSPLAGKKELSETLEINLSNAKNIIKISSDTTLIGKLVEIEIVYRDSIDYKKVEVGIFNFVNNNNYISEIVELYKESNIKLKEELNSEIKGLDSLQELSLLKLKKELKVNNKQQLVINTGKTNYYHDDIKSRVKEILGIEKGLKKIKGFDTIKPLTNVKIEYYPFIKVFFISIFLSILTAFILVFILEIKQQVKTS